MNPIERLQTSSVPTLANALELFGVYPANRGYSTQPLTCHFPGLGMAVGYAATATVSTDQPAGISPTPIVERDYWEYVASLGPSLAVVRDLDDSPGGAMWGEWNGNVHKALGCAGTITHGAVRDLDALDRLGFHVFSTRVSVSHGFGAFVGVRGAGGGGEADGVLGRPAVRRPARHAAHPAVGAGRRVGRRR
jgi:4-hydroxy-4-methyl-2-oxoglutarate aldolase